jgi:hypothetical protein
MHFQVVSGTAVKEFVERCETAAAALERVRALINSKRPNVRILTPGGQRYSLREIEELVKARAHRGTDREAAFLAAFSI